MRVQGPKRLGHLLLSQAISELGHEPVPMWDAGAAGKGLAYNATALAPRFLNRILAHLMFRQFILAMYPVSNVSVPAYQIEGLPW